MFHQWHNPPSIPISWYHQTSRDLVSWERHGPTGIACISGGAVLDPAGVPTLIVCPDENGVRTARPANLSDPLLRDWVVNETNIIPNVYKPPRVPGYWDVSAYRGYDGRYRLVVGSCEKYEGNGSYCGDTGTNGHPQVMVLESDDFEKWEYVGEVWRGTNVTFGQRTECPQMFDAGFAPNSAPQVAGLLVSIPYWYQQLFFTGRLLGNGSTFAADQQLGLVLDYGSVYAGQCLFDTPRSRQIYFGWVTGSGACGPLCANETWKGVLTLPRIIAMSDSGANGEPDVTWDVAPEVSALRVQPAAASRANWSLPAGSIEWVHLGGEASGTALEIRVEAPRAGGVVVGVRATPGREEQTYITYSDSVGLSVCTVTLNAPTSGVLPAQPACTSAPAPKRYAGGRPATVLLRVFVDNSVVEAHADGRASITTRVYPTRDDASGVFVANAGGGAMSLGAFDVWEMNGIYKST